MLPDSDPEIWSSDNLDFSVCNKVSLLDAVALLCGSEVKVSSKISEKANAEFNTEVIHSSLKKHCMEEKFAVVEISEAEKLAIVQPITAEGKKFITKAEIAIWPSSYAVPDTPTFIIAHLHFSHGFLTEGDKFEFSLVGTIGDNFEPIKLPIGQTFDNLDAFSNVDEIFQKCRTAVNEFLEKPS